MAGERVSVKLERLRSPGRLIQLLLIISAASVVLLTLDQLRLAGRPLLDSVIVLETHFYYALLALLLYGLVRMRMAAAPN